MSAPTLPASLVENPRLDRWIRFQPDRTVRIATGKVEIGQGVVTAIGQIAADELDVPLDRVAVLSGDTTNGPDELYTTSSLSIEVSGGSVRLVCAEVRAKALERAALRLNCSRDELTVVDGQFLQNGAATGQDYWTVAPEIDLSQAVTGTAPPKPASAYRVVGRSVPRVDLPAKVSGAAYVHDVLPKDVLHARTLRQPSRGATLAALDEAAIRRAAKGELQIVREANFVAFVSPVESVAQAAAVAAPQHATWKNVRRIDPGQQEAAWLKGQPSEDRRLGAPEPTASAEAPRADDRLAALHRARLDGAVLRAGRVPRRPSDGPIARPGHASAAQEPGSRTRSAARSHHRAASARRRLLRPQRRRRCGARRVADRHAPPRPVHPPAMAPRGGVRLRAGRACHDGDAARRSRRARPPGRLDDRDLERDPCAAAGQRQRLPARHGGPGEPAAGGDADRSARGARRRRPRATRCRSTTCRRTASCITWCCARRCAPRRCAAWARCPTSSPSNC